MVNDQQGTTHHQVNNATGALTTTWQNPYGQQRGTAPTTWTGERGFVGGTQDNTGLTHIGAREYDPTLQRFVSVDPVQDLADPLQWNPYLYANNTPIVKSDPTGKYADFGGGRTYYTHANYKPTKKRPYYTTYYWQLKHRRINEQRERERKTAQQTARRHADQTHARQDRIDDKGGAAKPWVDTPLIPGYHGLGLPSGVHQTLDLLGTVSAWIALLADATAGVAGVITLVDGPGAVASAPVAGVAARVGQVAGGVSIVSDVLDMAVTGDITPRRIGMDVMGAATNGVGSSLERVLRSADAVGNELKYAPIVAQAVYAIAADIIGIGGK